MKSLPEKEDGERKCVFCRIKEVPVLVREHTEQEVVEILIENIQRENLNQLKKQLHTS